RRPHLENFAFHAQFIAKTHRLRPAKLFKPQPDDSSGRLEFPFHHEFHSRGRRVPATGCQAAKDGAAGSIFIEMVRLRIKFSGKALDSLVRYPQSSGPVNLAYGKIFQIMLHGWISVPFGDACQEIILGKKRFTIVVSVCSMMTAANERAHAETIPAPCLTPKEDV